MRNLSLVVAVLALGACSKSTVDTSPSPSPSSTSPAPKAAASRWVWVPSDDGTFLAFVYVDKSAGPLARGGRVIGDPPSAFEVFALVEFSDRTFRDPIAMGARALTEDELKSLALPESPSWLSFFEPNGTPNGRLPKPTAAGRPTAQAGTLLQFACGPEVGKVESIHPGMAWEIGRTTSGGGLRVDAPGVEATHARFTSEGGVISVEPLAPMRVGGKTITAKTKLTVGDRIEIGPETILVRGTSGWAPQPGSDPSCPGYAERRWLQNGCWKFRKRELAGGAEVIVGSESAAGFQLGKPGGSVTARHVRLRNVGGNIEVLSLDASKPPTLHGKPIAKGKLAIGDQLRIGDEYIVVLDGDSKPAVPVPLAGCSDAGD